MSVVARVKLWGRTIGAVAMVDGRDYAAFEYTPDFAGSGIQVAPLMMSLSDRVWTFPALSRDAFSGLPGLLSDSLPDRYGNALIDAWLVRQGRAPGSFTPVERLCYTGARGMGALEFEPSEGPSAVSKAVDIAGLVRLASQVLSDRLAQRTHLDPAEPADGLQEILQVGTSAGGARAKAVIAWNPATEEARSGQVPVAQGFEAWLLKFDGVSHSGDHGFADPQGYCAIEYAYSLMAKAAGIDMTACRLMEEGSRRHFMTRRFDRVDAGKLHVQSLGALAHLDYNQPGAHSYEQALDVVRRLGLGMDAIEQQFRRMVFNVVARNQDDHVKNIAFVMDRRGRWALSPAFDITYSFNPVGDWTSQHQMSVNGKRDGFVRSDFRQVGRTVSMAKNRADAIVDEVSATVARWPEFAQAALVDVASADSIRQHHRLVFPERERAV